MYGPFLLLLAAWPAMALQPIPTAMLIFMGASTIAYNGRNWLAVP